MNKSIWALALFSATFLFNCSSGDNLSQQDSCLQQFQTLKEKFEKEKYSTIRIKLNDLISTCTGSGVVEEAQYLLAESHFNLKEWLEAEHEYSVFLEDFPASKFAENAHFRMAMAKMEQTQPIGRDQSKTREAISEFEDFMKSFQTSSLLDSAQKYHSNLQLKLAKKDIKTGDLYSKLKEPQAAVIYYKSVKDNYGNIINSDELNLKIIRSYIHLGQLKQAASLLEEVKESKNKKVDSSQIEKLELALAKKKKSAEEARLKKGAPPEPEL